MHLFKGTHPNAMYKEVASTILREGNKVTPRGLPTLELQPAVNVWTDPTKMVLTMPGRKNNPFFSLMEAVMIAAGVDDPETLGFYNKKILNYLDDGYDKFHAFYGTRIREWGATKEGRAIAFPTPPHDQFADVLYCLQDDPDSRQAVITLWIPLLDGSRERTKDRPCNFAASFKIRDGKLNMTVFNRSNDFFLGLYSVNILQFSMMQRILACLLKVKVGTYTHFSDSLHIYDMNVEDVSKVFQQDYEYDVYNRYKPFDLSKEWGSLEEFDYKAREFLLQEKTYRKTGNNVLDPSKLGTFFHACLCICLAYIYHKNGDYKRVIPHLLLADALGLRDHAVSCIEFVMRKYSQKNVGFEQEAMKMISNQFDYETVEYFQRH